jgi:hypothetical protein
LPGMEWNGMGAAAACQEWNGMERNGVGAAMACQEMGQARL